ncbi:MAG: arylsulfatase [Fimbriiglobus sp.]
MRMILMALWCLVGVGVASAAPPNVLIIMTDDNGTGDFSYTGNPVLKTPNFDKLARESVRLTDFHVCPMCSPTRGQLLSGISALRNGSTSVTAGRTFVRPELPLMPEFFAKAGYKTGMFGKWHIGDLYPFRPQDRGFDMAKYHLGWGMRDATPEFGNPLFDGRYYENGAAKKFSGHCTDFWFDSAQAWMADCQKQEKPFFCYIPTNAPHSPYVEKPEYLDMYKGKGPVGFLGMMAHLDDRMGDLDAFLTKSGLRENTIVVYMTDNGATAGQQIFNAGLRAGKTTLYDGGHRVPCWIRWPQGKLGEPRDINVPTQNTDLLPTLTKLCGVPYEPKLPEAERALFGGVDLSGLIRGEVKDVAPRMLVVQYGQVIEKFQSCVINGPWRLVNGTELYNMDEDRAQKVDLAAKQPDMKAAMRSHYEKWWNAVEPYVKEFIPNTIGAKQQPIVELTSADWDSIYADNSGHVRTAVGGPTGGHWHIQVAEAGEYEFALRRWPESIPTAIGARLEASENAPLYNMKKDQMKSFPNVNGAKVQAFDKVTALAAKASETSATTTITLPAGRTILKAWFTTPAGDACGAFFVTVRKVK